MSKKQENTKKEKVEIPEMESTNKSEEPKIMNVTMATVDENETNYKDLYLRAMADMDNLRKNTNKRIADIYQSANEKLIYEILSYLDSLDLAINNEKITNKEYNDGFEVLQKQLLDILARFGVKEIKIGSNEQFNADKMNAIMTIPTESAEQQNIVAATAKKGYMLFDKVLRYTDVVVYKYDN